MTDIIGTGYVWFSRWGNKTCTLQPYDTVCLAKKPNDTMAPLVPLNVWGKVREGDIVRLWAVWMPKGWRGVSRSRREVIGEGAAWFRPKSPTTGPILHFGIRPSPYTKTWPYGDKFIRDYGRGWGLGAWQLVMLEVEVLIPRDQAKVGAKIWKEIQKDKASMRRIAASRRAQKAGRLVEYRPRHGRNRRGRKHASAR